MDAKQQLKKRFDRTLLRVRGLIAASTQIPARAGPDGEAPTDILRAAVVLHAAMEDLLRTLEELTLRQASPATLKKFKVGYGRNEDEKLTLFQLATTYPGVGVDDVVRMATEAYLERQTYNNRADLRDLLKRLSIMADPLLDRFADDLDAMMRRRHKIAHRADYMSSDPDSFLSVLTHALHPSEVGSWSNIVNNFGQEVLVQALRSAP